MRPCRISRARYRWPTTRSAGCLPPISRRAPPSCRWRAGSPGAMAGRRSIRCPSPSSSVGLILNTLATTSIQFVFARIVQGAASGTLASSVAGDPAGCAAAGASCPDQPGVVGVPRARHQQRREHRRLAQRISRLALDLLFQPADGGLHLPDGGAVPPREESGAEPALRLLRPGDLLARHDRPADAARPRRAPGMVRLGGNLGRSGRLGAGILSFHRARHDDGRAFSQQGAVQGPQFHSFGDHVLRRRLRPAADPGFDLADAGGIAQLSGRYHRLHDPRARRHARGGGGADELRSGTNRQPAVRIRRHGGWWSMPIG